MESTSAVSDGPNTWDQVQRDWDELFRAPIKPSLGAESRAALLTLYNGLYAELRDKEARQQQAVTWGFTVLAGSGILGAVKHDRPHAVIVAIGLCGLLAAFVVVLIKSIRHYSRDGMSIARVLHRMHQVLDAFTKGSYYHESTLLPPLWQELGWGHRPDADANWRLTRWYAVLLGAGYLATCTVPIVPAVGS